MAEPLRRLLHWTLVPAIVAGVWALAESRSRATRAEAGTAYARDRAFHALVMRMREAEIADAARAAQNVTAATGEPEPSEHSERSEAAAAAPDAATSAQAAADLAPAAE